MSRVVKNAFWYNGSHLFGLAFLDSLNMNPASDSAETAGRLSDLVARSQRTMAHAWMVRTFVKHSDEVEDYPELNEVARAVFDAFRALETQVDDPASYFRFLRKKIGKMKSAASDFRKNAWHASTHTNFQQAVISIEYAVEQLEEVLSEAESLIPRAVPPRVTLPNNPASTTPSGSTPSAHAQDDD